MKADALEISKFSSTEKFGKEHPEIMKFPLIKSSDAHYPDDIGSAFTSFYINEASFDEIRKALKGEDGRKFITE
jgi:PHP family Zn ribbon phosphoesterase